MFEKIADRKNICPKVALMGLPGSGKTYSALRFTRGLVGENGRIAFLDTENGSSSLYSDLTDFYPEDIKPAELKDKDGETTKMFRVEDFVKGIVEAYKAGFDAIIIDSASQVWQGVMDLKNRIDQNGGNQYTNWKIPKEKMNKAKACMLQAPIAVVNCFRSKVEYVMEKNENGLSVPRRVGLAPMASGDAEYDYTLFFDLDREHRASIVKSRCPLFPADFNDVLTEEHGKMFKEWISK